LRKASQFEAMTASLIVLRAASRRRPLSFLPAASATAGFLAPRRHFGKNYDKKENFFRDVLDGYEEEKMSPKQLAEAHEKEKLERKKAQRRSGGGGKKTLKSGSQDGDFKVVDEWMVRSQFFRV
jgi:hypothetical protein